MLAWRNHDNAPRGSPRCNYDRGLYHALQRLNLCASLFAIFRVKIYGNVHHAQRGGVRCAVLRLKVNDFV